MNATHTHSGGNTGMADIHLGQNDKNGINYILLDHWTGYPEQTAMALSSVNETADTQSRGQRKLPPFLYIYNSNF